jgi:hypothetical protein
MILETLDVKKNDIFIYSLNQFDFVSNFKLINKDSKIKYPKSIHYNDVCKHINDSRPKNLIVYRLLTNIPHLDPDYLKYAFVLSVDGHREAIYFDPVFAVKELEEFSDIEQYPFLRFRIQQIGLIFSLGSFGSPTFHEVYAFDLEAVEVKHQNDRVFAEIIFAFDEVHFDEEDVVNAAQRNRNIPERRFSTMASDEPRSDFVEEDPASKADTIKKLRTSRMNTAESLAQRLRTDAGIQQAAPQQSGMNRQDPIANKPQPKAKPEKEETPKPAVPSEPLNKSLTSKQKPTFGDFLSKVKKDLGEEPVKEEKRPRVQTLNIFKTSSHIQDFVEEREKKQVVLKLKKGAT